MPRPLQFAVIVGDNRYLTLNSQLLNEAAARSSGAMVPANKAARTNMLTAFLAVSQKVFAPAKTKRTGKSLICLIKAPETCVEVLSRRTLRMRTDY
jgi:hypothetical protein